MISYNLSSLFTSIPLKEAIDIAVDLLFEHNPDFKITKNKLKKLFDFATSGNHFLFDGSFYDQIDGVAMASLLVLFWLTCLWVIMKLNGCKYLKIVK